MDSNQNYSPEELEKQLEKAKKAVQEALEKMTPEERERAMANAGRMIEEDRISMQKTIEEARAVANGDLPNKGPKFCPNCGAEAGGGNFCEYCGSRLK